METHNIKHQFKNTIQESEDRISRFLEAHIKQKIPRFNIMAPAGEEEQIKKFIKDVIRVYE